jgi:hypothetical protein
LRGLAIKTDSLRWEVEDGESDTTMARRAQLVAEWRVSGEPKATFARRHGVHPRTFWGWCREAAEPSTVADVAVPVFVLVAVVDTEDAGARALEIVLTSGDRVCLRGALTRDWLASAVAALRRAC